MGGSCDRTALPARPGAVIFGRDFPDLHVRVSPGAEGSVVDLVGEAIEGQLQLPAAGVNRWNHRASRMDCDGSARGSAG